MVDGKMIIFDLSTTIIQQGTVPHESHGFSDPAIFFEDYTGGTKDFRITLLNMGAHSGTHCDTPSHFLFDKDKPLGKTITDYDVKNFIGRAVLLNFYDHGQVRRADIQQYRQKVVDEGYIPILRNSQNPKDSFTPDARQEIADWHPQFVIGGEGWDHVSSEDASSVLYPDTEFYLRQAQIPVIMNVDHEMMSRVRDGDLIIALPIKLHNLEAAPVRLIAIRWAQ